VLYARRVPFTVRRARRGSSPAARDHRRPAPRFLRDGVPGRKPGVLNPRVFPGIPISPASEANFHAHNLSSLGSFVEIVRHDGRGASLIPPTLDIDPEMHRALVQLGSLVTIEDPIAG
jgi:hypothetical protein